MKGPRADSSCGAAALWEQMAKDVLQIKDDLPNWQTERAVRRVARRGMLLDCRTRFRHEHPTEDRPGPAQAQDRLAAHRLPAR